MKVERLQEKKRVSDVSSKKGKSVKSGEGLLFFRTLAETSQKQKKQKLNSLLEKIDNQASELASSLTLAALREYKNLIRNFIEIAINGVFEVNEKVSISPKGKSKILITVKKINSAIDELTQDFFNKSRNIVEFMAKLDQIKGLLIDLYS